MATSKIKDAALKLVAKSNFAQTVETKTYPLDASKSYLLITTRTGYGIPNARGNAYLLGVTAIYSNYTKLTGNDDAIAIDVSDNANLVLTSDGGQSRFWLFSLS